METIEVVMIRRRGSLGTAKPPRKPTKYSHASPKRA